MAPCPHCGLPLRKGTLGWNSHVRACRERAEAVADVCRRILGEWRVGNPRPPSKRVPRQREQPHQLRLRFGNRSP